MSYKLGLTGTIGSGKSTAAGFFRDAGIPVWDADAVVHALYAKGGAGVRAIEALTPTAIKDGAVDRNLLRKEILRQPPLLDRVEAVIHPLVKTDREVFLERFAAAPLVLCDIPLLFETGADADMDGILVVTADPDILKTRVLNRPNMTEAAFQAILAKQMPDAEKCSRADYVIDTGKGLDHARAAVHDIIEQIRAKYA